MGDEESESDEDVVSKHGLGSEYKDLAQMGADSAAKLGVQLGFLCDTDDKTKDLLGDLHLAFGNNGKQTRRKKKISRLVEEGEASISDEFWIEVFKLELKGVRH